MKQQLVDSHTSRIRRDGLHPGERAPHFVLPTVTGDSVSLHAFAGARLLLVFSDPECEPCNNMAPKLQRLAQRAGDIRVLMISRGTLERNIEKVNRHRLTFPVAIQPQWQVSKRYALFATPVAYLIDADGHIATAPAIGGDAVLTLLRAAAIQSLLEDADP